MQTTSVESPPKSILTGLLCRLTEFCARNCWLVLLITVASAIGCVYYSAQNLKFKTDRTDLIDPSAEFQQRWRRYQKAFGETDDLVVVVEGKQTKAIKAALDEIGSRLSKQPEHFANVFFKIDPGVLHEKGLQYLPPEVLTEGLERLEAFRPILKGDWELISLDEIVTRISRQLGRRQTDPRSQVELLQQTELLTTSLSNTLKDRDAFTNPWPQILPIPSELQSRTNQTEYLLSESGTMGFVMATAVNGNGTFEGPTAAIDVLRRNLKEASKNNPDVRVLLTGIAVLENDEMRRSMSDSTIASVISFIGVAVLLFWGFRGFRRPMAGLFMLVIGMAWSFGYTTFAVGHLNILSVSFAAMLLGLGIDFAIHMLSRYRELRLTGQGLIDALRGTTESVGVGIVTGAVTTSLAFFCAMLTDFLGVAELGMIAGGGILLCALAAFTVLPAILALTDRVTEIGELPKPQTSSLLRKATQQHPGLVFVASLVCVGYFGAQAFDWSGKFPTVRVAYDHNLLHLQAEGLESVRAQKQIFNSSRQSLLYAVSMVDSIDEVQSLKEKFEQLESIRQVQELASRLPQAPASKTQLLVHGFHSQLALLPEEPPEPRAANPANVGQALEALCERLKPRTDAVSKKIVKSIDRFLDQLDQLSTRDQIAFLSEFEFQTSYALLEQLKSIAAASNPEPVTVTDLPHELKSRFVSPEGKWLLQIFPKEQIWDMAPLERFVNDVRSVDPEVTGTPLQNYEAARQIKRSYEICAVYALVVILITLLVDFTKRQHLVSMFAPAFAITVIIGFLMQARQLPLNPGVLLILFTTMTVVLALIFDPSAIGDSLLALMPPVVGFGMTCGVLVMFEIPLNPANLIILPLILGIGVDNGVHILHDFHANPRQVYSPSPSTKNSIVLTSTTTIVGFGSLMISTHRGLYSLGAVLAIGVGASLFVSLVTLPALLAWISRGRPQIEVEQTPEEQIGDEVVASIAPLPTEAPEVPKTEPAPAPDPTPAPREQIIVQEPVHVA